MLLDVEHRLSFGYDAPISESYLELRVEPRTTPGQSLRSFFLAVGPPVKIARYVDWNGNLVHHFGVTGFHDRIEVLARSVVDTHAAAVDLSALPDTLPFGEASRELLDFVAFGGPVQRSRRLTELAAALPVASERPIGEQIGAIGSFLHGRFRYRQDVTTFESSIDDILEHEGGVCQDFAHLMLALLRLRGIPCRYVSGYLHVEPTDRPSQSHAWVEVWCPSVGWVGFDPTQARSPDEAYVLVGHGRHYDDVPPNRGIFRGAAQEMLEAEVRTQPGKARAVAGLHEEMGSIDVPVFHELPARHAPLHSPAEGAGQQQQQQQQ